MSAVEKDILIEEIEIEVCGFGSKRLALKEFAKMTGTSAFERLLDLRAYLKSVSEETLKKIAEDIKPWLNAAAYPKAT